MFRKFQDGSGGDGEAAEGRGGCDSTAGVHVDGRRHAQARASSTGAATHAGGPPLQPEKSTRQRETRATQRQKRTRSRGQETEIRGTIEGRYLSSRGMPPDHCCIVPS